MSLYKKKLLIMSSCLLLTAYTLPSIAEPHVPATSATATNKKQTPSKTSSIASKKSSASSEKVPPLSPSPQDELVVIVHGKRHNTKMSVYGQKAKDIAQSTARIDMNNPLVSSSTRLEEFADYIPGVLGAYGGTTEDGTNSAVSIRGFTLSEDFHADGVTTPYLATVQDPATLEGVEVSKGLNSVLFGSGQPGGMVNYVTKKPKLKSKRTLSVSGSSPAGLRTFIDLTGALFSSQSWAGRMIVSGQQAETDYDNVGDDRFLISPQALWLDENQSLLIAFKQAWQNREPGNRTIFHNSAPVYNTSYVDPRSSSDHRESDINLNYNRNFGEKWEANIKARYSEIKQDTVDISYSGLSKTPNQLTGRYREIQREEKNHTIRAELTHNHKTDENQHTTTLGISDLSFDIHDSEKSAIGSFLLDIKTPSFSYALPTPDKLSSFGYLGKWHEQGLYINHVSKLNDKTSIAAGVRSSTRETDAIHSTNSLKTANSKDVSKSIGITRQLTPNWQVFASHIESYDSNIGFDISGNLFNPQQSKQVEAGIRYEHATDQEKPLQIDISTYKINQQNIKSEDNIDDIFFTSVIDINSRGLDISVEAPLNKQIDFGTGYNYNDTRIMNYDVDYQADKDLLDNPFEMEKNRLAGRPYHHASAHLDYTPNAKTKISLGAVHVGKRPGNNINTFSVPAYTRLDASAQWKLDKDTTLKANVRNLLDEDYVQSVSSRTSLSQGSKRSITIGLEVDF